MCLMAGCAVDQPVTIPALEKVSGPKATQLLTATLNVIETETPRPDPTDVSTSTPTITPPELKIGASPDTSHLVSKAISPAVVASRIFIGSWSPDSQWLAYWTFTEGEVEVDYTYPAGSLYFVHAKTGEICEAIQSVRYPYVPVLPVKWQPDGSVILRADKVWIQTVPCGKDFEIISNLPNDGSESISVFSPSGKYELTSISSYNLDNTEKLVQTITETVTKKVLNTIGWTSSRMLDQFDSGGEWITDELFLIRDTIEKGPQLIQVNQDPINVLTDLFNLQPDDYCLQPICEVRLLAEGTHIQQSSDYQIVLSGRGAINKLPSLLLYNSIDQQIRTLDFTSHGGFSPTGETIILLNTSPESQSLYNLSMLSIENMDGEVKFLLQQRDSPLPPSWSPDGLKVAFHSAGELPIFQVPEGIRDELWIANANLFPGPWSPNGEKATAIGHMREGKVGLFIVEVGMFINDPESQ
jgi:hypothetical protein